MHKLEVEYKAFKTDLVTLNYKTDEGLQQFLHKMGSR